MDVRDIRYLHDDRILEDDELEDELPGRPVLTRKNIIAFSFIGFLLISIGIVTANITQQTMTRSSAQSDGTQVPPSEPTIAPIQVEGTVECLPSAATQENKECDIAIETREGEVYALQNVQYNDVSSGKIVPGKKVTLTGVFIPAGATGGGEGVKTSGTLYIVSNNEGSGGVSTPGIDTPTSTPTTVLTPTPTPLPFSVPTPAISYYTVKYIVDNKGSLNGKNVPLGAYIVTDQQPDPDCPQGEDCSRVQFIVNDAAGDGRDESYDTLLITNTTNEGEILFTPGQNIFASVTVVVLDGKVTLLLDVLD